MLNLSGKIKTKKEKGNVKMTVKELKEKLAKIEDDSKTVIIEDENKIGYYYFSLEEEQGFLNIKAN